MLPNDVFLYFDYTDHIRSSNSQSFGNGLMIATWVLCLA